MELAIKSASILQHSNAEDRTAASQLQLSEFDSNNIICISFFFYLVCFPCTSQGHADLATTC